MSTLVNLLNSWLRSWENDHPTKKNKRRPIPNKFNIKGWNWKKKLSKNDLK
jgi:hypothetical protein